MDGENIRNHSNGDSEYDYHDDILSYYPTANKTCSDSDSSVSINFTDSYQTDSEIDEDYDDDCWGTQTSIFSSFLAAARRRRIATNQKAEIKTQVVSNPNRLRSKYSNNHSGDTKSSVKHNQGKFNESSKSDMDMNWRKKQPHSEAIQQGSLSSKRSIERTSNQKWRNSADVIDQLLSKDDEVDNRRRFNGKDKSLDTFRGSGDLDKQSNTSINKNNWRKLSNDSTQQPRWAEADENWRKTNNRKDEPFGNSSFDIRSRANLEELTRPDNGWRCVKRDNENENVVREVYHTVKKSDTDGNWRKPNDRKDELFASSGCSKADLEGVRRFKSDNDSNWRSKSKVENKNVIKEKYDGNKSINIGNFGDLNKKSKIDIEVFSESIQNDENQISTYTSRLNGKIINIIKSDAIDGKPQYGFIRPLEQNNECDNVKDIYFNAKFIESGGLAISEYDKVTFCIRTTLNKPEAVQIKVAEFVQRSANEIETYLYDMQGFFEKNEETHNDGEKRQKILSLLSCRALWECIGNTKSLDAALVHIVLELLIFVHRNTRELEEAFLVVLKAITNTAFLNPWKGPLTRYSLSDSFTFNNRLKEFLKLVILNVPEKSSAAMTLLKPLVSSDDSSMEFYLFSLLLQTTSKTSDVAATHWSAMPLVPVTSELTSCEVMDEDKSLAPVSLVGPYHSTEEYMNTYFSLLREDSFHSLREGVKSLVRGDLDLKDMNVYHSIVLTGVNFHKRNQGIALELKIHPAREVEDWNKCTQLMFGNLLCLSVSGTFQDPIWAVVVGRDTELLNTKRLVYIELITECNLMSTSAVIVQLSQYSGNVIAVESPTYYNATKPVLAALQKKSVEGLPFEDQLVNVNTAPVTPEYMNLSPTEFQTSSKLDNSQTEAFQNVFQNKIGIIQGPPGTGKTFIGVQIVKFLMSAVTLPGPVIILTYKNHALDEFLKSVLNEYPHPEYIARVGGGCKESSLEDIRLNKLQRSVRRSQYFTELFGETDVLKSSVERATSELLRNLSCNVDTLLTFLSNGQIMSLLYHCNWNNLYLYGRRLSLTTIQQIINGKEQTIKEYLKSKDADNVRSRITKLISLAFAQWYPGHEVESKVKRSLGIPACMNIKSMYTFHDPQNDDLDEDNFDEDMYEDLLDERSDVRRKKQEFNPKDSVPVNLDQGSPCLFSISDNYLNQLPAIKLLSCDNLWSLDLEDRVLFLQCVLKRQSASPLMTLSATMTAYQQACALKNELDIEHKVNVLKNKKIIGMTITGASINHSLVKQISPAVMLVEEAAEVLEPHLIAAIGSSVQHLILIGDHKQLRPQVQHHLLKSKFHFDISMMERLIKNDYPFKTLLMQNRMHPEISLFLRDIYPGLQDNLSVVAKNTPPVSLDCHVFFWDHDVLESGEKSRINTEEAERAARLGLFLLSHTTQSHKITILAAYQSQKLQIKSALSDLLDKVSPQVKELSKDCIAIHTIDMYQGDENDIVIVSLVRSNPAKDIGFMKELNRRCVAQSRSRCGLYFIGNSQTFSSSRNWKELFQQLLSRKLIDSCLTISCPYHSEVKIKALKSTDVPLDEFCTQLCTQSMHCGIHRCPQICHPYHSHNKCMAKFNFQFPRCLHMGKRLCFQREEDIECKKNCEQKMACGLHPCARRCDPPHDHHWCSERIKCTLLCGHEVDKQCSEHTARIVCQEEVTVEHPTCNHLITKVCHQDAHSVSCTHPCRKSINGCGHPCQGKCGKPCTTVDSCKYCQDTLQEMKRIAERKEKEKKQQYIAQLKIQLKQIPDAGVIITEIKQSGENVEEYNNVCDRVKRFVIPHHNWIPEIKRICKVSNSRLYEKWIEAHENLYGSVDTRLLFHGTTSKAAESIMSDGFKLPKKAGMFGKGIYFATDSSKSALYSKDSNILLLCEVLIGRCYNVKSAEKGMSPTELEQRSCDSVYAARGTKSTGGVYNDEYIVYNPHQAVVRYVIYYECREKEHDLAFLRTNSGKAFTHHVLTPKRGVSMNDTQMKLDMNFRWAESQFLRMKYERNLPYKLKQIEFYENVELIKKFQMMASKMQSKYSGQSESEFIYAFHGTKVENIMPIVKDNFRLDKLASNTGNRGNYGAGIYFTEYPDVSFGYAGHTKVLMCLLLPGKAYDCSGPMPGAPLQEGYDSHRARKDDHDRGHELVIFNSDQILPCYVVEIERI